MKILRIIFYSLLFFLVMPCLLSAQDKEPYSVDCTWIKDADTVLCISLAPDEGYYTYAPQQEHVYPTRIFIYANSEQQDNLQEIPCLFPFGTWKDDAGLKQRIRVLEGTTRIYMLFPKLPEGQYTGNIEISLVACSKEHCLPVTLQKTVAAVPAVDISSFQYKEELESFLLAYAQKNLAKEQIIFAAFRQKKDNCFSTVQENQTEATQQYEDENLLAENGNLNAFSLDTLKKQAENFSAQKDLEQDNTQIENHTDFSVRPFYHELEVQSLLKALLFGIIAGFILNFMPCVLPVIALKLHALLGVSAKEFSLQEQRSFREQMLFFSLGICVWFVVLAFLFGGLGLTWGQLFQEYWLMLALCILVFVLALSLFDVFHLPIINLRAIEQKNAKLDAFLSGFLATILATPCSGPLLGGVLGFVLTQLFWVIVLVFVCMGMGMALPYLVFAVNPRLAAFMPKAGNWLLVMEKVLAFFLLGTALYLFSLLPDFLHIKALVFLFVFCVCLYIWGKWASLTLAKKQKRLTGAGLCVIVLVCFYYLFVQSAQNEKKSFWQEFQSQQFTQNLGQKTLLLKFTADWCPTCKVLEQTVFTDKNMQSLAKIAGEKNKDEIEFILVDMTRFEEEKQVLLSSLGSASIPFLAVFPKNNPYQPFIVRDIYTFNMVEQVLKKAVQE